MIQNIKQLKLNYHYISDLECIYGKVDDYFFTSRPLDRMNMIAINFSVTRINTVKPQIQNLRTQYEAIAPGGVYDDGNTLSIEVNMVNLSQAEDYANIIEAITAILKEQGCENVCGVSDNQEDIGIYRIGTHVHILSTAAYQNLTQEQSTNYQPKRNSLFISYLLALGGLLLGAGIWILLGRVRFVSGIAGFFMLNFAVRGFKQGGAQLIKRDIYVLLALALVTIVFSEIFSVAISFAWGQASISIFEAAGLYIKQLISGIGLQSFVTQILIGVGLSLWSSWSLIQHLLNFTPVEGKRVQRKNNRLL